MRKQINQVTIQQTPAGWLWQERGVYSPTAHKALAKVKSDDNLKAMCGITSISLITWHTTDHVGSMVVKAITGKS